MHYYVDVVERQPRGADSDASWSRSYAELWPRLVRAVAASVGTYSGVEDAVQEAFVSALSEDRQRIDNLGGWLYTVALRSISLEVQVEDEFAGGAVGEVPLDVTLQSVNAYHGHVGGRRQKPHAFVPVEVVDDIRERL